MNINTSNRALLRKLTRHAGGLIPSGYELTNRCNLKCEGCFFYEGENYAEKQALDESAELARYEQLFAAEVARGVTYPHFTGGDPSLVQERLRLAAKYWKYGVVYTNGTIRIDPAIPFMLHIGIWSPDEQKDAHFRGAPTLHKIVRNYAGDPRAIVNFTLNHQNIDEIEAMCDWCRSHRFPLTFNLYSPTRQYTRKLALPSGERESATFRFSSEENSLTLTDADLQSIRQKIDRAIDDYPGTVVYSHHFNAWLTRPQPLVTIDPASGMATDCVIFNHPIHRQYKTDFSYNPSECCVPNNDCRHCRLYPVAYSQYLSLDRHPFRNKASTMAWIEVMEIWCRLHLTGWDELS